MSSATKMADPERGLAPTYWLRQPRCFRLDVKELSIDRTRQATSVGHKLFW